MGEVDTVNRLKRIYRRTLCRIVGHNILTITYAEGFGHETCDRCGRGTAWVGVGVDKSAMDAVVLRLADKIREIDERVGR